MQVAEQMRQAKRRPKLLLFALALTLSLVGCSQEPRGTIVFDETRTLGPAGGIIESETYGVSATFGEGTLQSKTPVTLTVFDKQFLEVGRDGYKHSFNGVHLVLDPLALAPGAAISIELAHVGAYDDFGTMLAVKRDDGAFMVLPSDPATSGKVRGVLSKSALDILFLDVPHKERQT
jgi:hypothetical protein